MRVTVDLTWNENTESDLAGYKVYWSAYKQPEKYVTLLLGVQAVRLSVRLKPKVAYTFFVTAYDKAGNESTRSTLKAVYLE